MYPFNTYRDTVPCPLSWLYPKSRSGTSGTWSTKLLVAIKMHWFAIMSVAFNIINTHSNIPHTSAFVYWIIKFLFPHNTQLGWIDTRILNIQDQDPRCFVLEEKRLQFVKNVMLNNKTGWANNYQANITPTVVYNKHGFCYGVGKRPPLYFFDKMHTTIH